MLCNLEKDLACDTCGIATKLPKDVATVDRWI
jgi:hypothetical protein